MRPMEKLLAIWPTIKAISDALGLPYQTVASWRVRGIPARRCAFIVRKAREVGHVISVEDLLRLHDEDAA